jgi:catechol 2,3-dioxygenase-like lactoylglutathione lyase family enzyme
MYSHMMVGSNDIQRSKTFYDALFGATGGSPAFVDPKGRLVYMHRDNIFIVTRPIDGAPATKANGLTIGFSMENPDEADAWHAAGVGAGGTAIEDPPGWREGSFGRLYLAYLRDPDGHKLCALYREG